MTLTPYSTSTIRTELKSYLDSITGAELYEGYIRKPSELTSDQVPTYFITDTGFSQVEMESSKNYINQNWLVTIVYDDPQSDKAMNAISALKDQVRVNLSSREENLSGTITFFVPDSVNSSGQQDIQIGSKWYVSYPIEVATRVCDIVR